MLVDIVFPGWVPFAYLALAEDVYGYVQAHDIALNYDFDTFVGGHLTRLGTRDNVQIQKEFITDLINASIRANNNVTFGEIIQKVGGPTNNVWAIFNTYLDTVAEQCTNEMLPKWQQRLGGAEDFMFSHCWTMAQSLRIDPTTKTLLLQYKNNNNRQTTATVAEEPLCKVTRRCLVHTLSRLLKYKLNLTCYMA